MLRHLTKGASANQTTNGLFLQASIELTNSKHLKIQQRTQYGYSHGIESDHLHPIWRQVFSTNALGRLHVPTALTDISHFPIFFSYFFLHGTILN